MIDKIKEYYQLKKSFRVDTYKKMVTLIMKNIEIKAMNEETFYLYEIPEFILGEPTYDIKECSDFLVKELKKHKFTDVSYYEPNVIYISWKLD